MKVILDRSLCSGHGRCYVLAPELFGSDDDGYSVVLREEVPPELEGKARSAVENCPERAISLA